MARPRKLPTTEGYCIVAPIAQNRRWFATEAAAVATATAMMSHTDKYGAQLIVVKAVASIEPATAPVKVLRQFSLPL